MQALPITTVFIGLLAIAQIPLTVMVGHYRLKSGIHFLDGGDKTLLRRMRAHGNFTETVPIVLLAMAASELGGLAASFLWLGGASLIVGRFMHATTIIRVGWGNARAAGMILTFLPMLGFGLWCLSKATG